MLTCCGWQSFKQYLFGLLILSKKVVSTNWLKIYFTSLIMPFATFGRIRQIMSLILVIHSHSIYNGSIAVHERLTNLSFRLHHLHIIIILALYTDYSNLAYLRLYFALFSTDFRKFIFTFILSCVVESLTFGSKCKTSLSSKKKKSLSHYIICSSISFWNAIE